MSNIETESFGINEFEILQNLTHSKCPNGCISKTTTLSKDGTKLNMKFDRNDCQKCPLLNQCLREKQRAINTKARTIQISIRHDAVLRDMERNKTQEFN